MCFYVKVGIDFVKESMLNKIKNEIDPTLAYRRSCAHGVCGSCAMNMGGKNGLACTTPHAGIEGDIDIYPLPHLKVKKDLNLFKVYVLLMEPLVIYGYMMQEKQNTEHCINMLSH